MSSNTEKLKHLQAISKYDSPPTNLTVSLPYEMARQIIERSNRRDIPVSWVAAELLDIGLRVTRGEDVS